MSNFDIYTNYKTILSVNAFIYAEGKLLLLKRAPDKKVDPNKYHGVGGKVEPHEDFLSALRREIEEETGIKELKSIRLYSVTQHPYPPTDSEWVNLYFIVTLEKIVPVPATSDGEFFWINPIEALQLETPTDIHKYLEILSKDPNAFVFGYFDHDKNGAIIEQKIEKID